MLTRDLEFRPGAMVVRAGSAWPGERLAGMTYVTFSARRELLIRHDYGTPGERAGLAGTPEVARLLAAIRREDEERRDEIEAARRAELEAERAERDRMEADLAA
jgi:hypothetical protein